MKTREQMLEDLKFAIEAEDLPLAEAIDKQIKALDTATPQQIGKNRLNQLLTQGGQLAVGAGKGLVGGVNALTKGLSLPDLGATRQPPLQDFRQVDEILGTGPASVVGEVLNPLNLGMGKLAKAHTIPQKILEGAAMGAGSAATQYGGEGDVAAGAGTGAVISTLLAPFGKVGQVFQKAFPGKAEKLAPKHVLNTVGEDNIERLVKEVDTFLAKKSPSKYPYTTSEIVAHLPEASPWLALRNHVVQQADNSPAVAHRMIDQGKALTKALERQAAFGGATTRAAKALDKDIERIINRRETFAAGPLQSTSIEGVPQLGKTGDIMPPFLATESTIGRWLLNMVGPDRKKLAKEIGKVEAMMDLHPEEFAKAFRNLPKSKQEEINRALKTLKVGTIAGANQGFVPQDY